MCTNLIRRYMYATIVCAEDVYVCVCDHWLWICAQTWSEHICMRPLYVQKIYYVCATIDYEYVHKPGHVPDNWLQKCIGLHRIRICMCTKPEHFTEHIYRSIACHCGFIRTRSGFMAWLRPTGIVRRGWRWDWNGGSFTLCWTAICHNQYVDLSHRSSIRCPHQHAFLSRPSVNHPVLTSGCHFGWVETFGYVRFFAAGWGFCMGKQKNHVNALSMWFCCFRDLWGFDEDRLRGWFFESLKAIYVRSSAQTCFFYA